MKNSVQANIAFYFKGEKFVGSVEVDLDVYFRTHKDVSFIYDMLAKNMGLDEYRHEYDVMVMQTIVYDKADGLVAEYIREGLIDWTRLERAWQKQSDFKVLMPIANKFFNVENLEDDPKLASALLAAYRAGQDKSPDTVEAKTSLNEGFYG